MDPVYERVPPQSVEPLHTLYLGVPTSTGGMDHTPSMRQSCGVEARLKCACTTPVRLVQRRGYVAATQAELGAGEMVDRSTAIGKREVELTGTVLGGDPPPSNRRCSSREQVRSQTLTGAPRAWVTQVPRAPAKARSRRRSRCVGLLARLPGPRGAVCSLRNVHILYFSAHAVRRTGERTTQNEHCLCHLATGDMLRAAVAAKTPLGMKVRRPPEWKREVRRRGADECIPHPNLFPNTPEAHR